MRIINRQQVSRLAIMPYPIACGRKGKANHQQAIKEFEEPDRGKRVLWNGGERVSESGLRPLLHCWKESQRLYQLKKLV